MAGRHAYIAGRDPTPPGRYDREQTEEWRRGYKDARLWQQRRATMTRGTAGAIEKFESQFGDALDRLSRS